MKNSLKSNGFTLIEVLISLVILAISLLALAGLMTTSTRNTAAGGRLTEAATFAQDKLEELRAIKWSDVASNSDIVTSSTGITYTLSWEIVPVPPPPPNLPNDDLKGIIITVRWPFDPVNPTLIPKQSLRFFSALSK